MKITGNVTKDSRECSRRFLGMFKRILGNLNLVKSCMFFSNVAVNLLQNNRKNNYWAILL